MHQTDNLVPITGIVYASKPAYSNKKVRKHVLEKGYIVALAADYLTKHMSLEKEPIIVLKKMRNLKEHIVQGQTFPSGRVELDPTLPIEELILITTHEFVHLDQFEDGRLSFQTDNDGNFTHPIWQGVVHSLSLKEERDFDRYLSLPWEREAFTRANSVYKRVKKHLNKIVGPKTLK